MELISNDCPAVRFVSEFTISLIEGVSMVWGGVELSSRGGERSGLRMSSLKEADERRE